MGRAASAQRSSCWRVRKAARVDRRLTALHIVLMDLSRGQIRLLELHPRDRGCERGTRAEKGQTVCRAAKRLCEKGQAVCRAAKRLCEKGQAVRRSPQASASSARFSLPGPLGELLASPPNMALPPKLRAAMLAIGVLNMSTVGEKRGAGTPGQSGRVTSCRIL